MIYDDLLRQILLLATSSIFLGFALWALIGPHALADTLGYQLQSKNAVSEFHAIYIGVFIAQALLCMLAAYRIEDALLGNLVAVFLLAQPLGRAVAAFRGSMPSGSLMMLFIAELTGGIILLVVQPTAQ